MRPGLLVATGQPGPNPDTCYVSKPAYHKSPFLSVLYSMFIHEGWLHLLGNMLFLLIFGNNVEDRMGRLPYLAFYVFCGYIAERREITKRKLGWRHAVMLHARDSALAEFYQYVPMPAAFGESACQTQ